MLRLAEMSSAPSGSIKEQIYNTKEVRRIGLRIYIKINQGEEKC